MGSNPANRGPRNSILHAHWPARPTLYAHWSARYSPASTHVVRDVNAVLGAVLVSPADGRPQLVPLRGVVDPSRVYPGFLRCVWTQRMTMNGSSRQQTSRGRKEGSSRRPRVDQFTRNGNRGRAVDKTSAPLSRTRPFGSQEAVREVPSTRGRETRAAAHNTDNNTHPRLKAESSKKRRATNHQKHLKAVSKKIK